MSGAIAANSHAERMDGVYRIQRHFYDLTRKYYLLGRDRLIEELNAGTGCQVLEIGCGTGRNLIAAARRWPKASFTGLDISTAMLETAHASIARGGYARHIGLAQADACTFTANDAFADKRFDRIFMSYTLSMIPAWELALEEAAGALAPGGKLHIVDFGQQERLPRWFKSVLITWLQQFHVTPRAALPAVLEELAQRHDLALDFTPLYRGYAWGAVLTAR
ncbi:MAG: methyltransferase domain-containing protein [Sphingobium sp.]|nr:class I SAM-dependent methyltransferase [Sphingomonas sp.]